MTSQALANAAMPVHGDLPRMADFMTWIYRACPSLGWDPSMFEAAYKHNRITSVDAELGASPLTAPLLELIEVNRDEWSGTMAYLLKVLTINAGDAAKGRRWPSDPTRLSGELRRLAPSLRTLGIHVQFERENSGARTRLVIISRRQDAGSD